MTLDRWISIFFLSIFIVYGYAAYDYPLLPFEKHMAFLPNTLPKALSVIGIMISGFILVTSKVNKSGEDVEADNANDIDLKKLHTYKTGQAIAILVAMVIYALLLRPLGFIPSTILFLVGCGWILGERKLHIMILVASIGAFFIWYLVQEVLGIFLKPLPWFFG